MRALTNGVRRRWQLVGGCGERTRVATDSRTNCGNVANRFFAALTAHIVSNRSSSITKAACCTWSKTSNTLKFNFFEFEWRFSFIVLLLHFLSSFTNKTFLPFAILLFFIYAFLFTAHYYFILDWISPQLHEYNVLFFAVLHERAYTQTHATYI